MTFAKIAPLEDRGVVSVTGEDGLKFLDSIITNDVSLVGDEGAIFAGLLTPQGKILFDFFVVKAADGYLLDVARDQVAALVKRLSLYKLRAKVVIAEVTGAHVFASWEDGGQRLGFADPRLAGLGHRTLTEKLLSEGATAADYHAHRIALGVPEGGRDFAFGEAFPHEANMDQLNGVSFTKGCYVGQEIVARMEHRGTARRRIVRVSGEGSLPVAGTEVLAGEVVIGAMGSSSGSLTRDGSGPHPSDGFAYRASGLAMLRIDRVAEFGSKGVALTAGGVVVTTDAGDVARLMPRSPDPVAFG